MSQQDEQLHALLSDNHEQYPERQNSFPLNPSQPPLHHFSGSAKMSELKKNPNTQTCDFGGLLEARDVALITLVVGETQLVVHRSVLVAKSPVFAAMLTHDTVEASSSRIIVTDVEPKVLQQLLLFMYKDCVPQLCSMATQLLVVADKYCVLDLKAQCELQLVIDLAVENVVSSALLALRHSCPRLKETAGHFLEANLTRVMDTEGWAEAVRNNPEEFMELNRLLASTSNICQEEMDRKLLLAVENKRLKEVEDLLATGAYVGARDASGRSTLHSAATTEIASCLLEAGALVSARDKWHRTPLHAAVQRGNTDVARQLVGASGNVNAADLYGDTPLHLAAQLGNYDAVKVLLTVGADKGARNNLGETPSDVADRYKNESLMAMLSVSGSAKMLEINGNSKTSACDFSALLEARDVALVTLVAGETQLAVHRSVLVAKSPVLAAMLAHNEMETGNCRIVVTDVELKVLQQLLLFMYKDSTPQLCSMAPQLLVAADKYCILDLKGQCELQLVEDLSVENVVSTALLALRHSCPHLKETAGCFLKANLAKVMGTGGWAEAVRNNAEEFVELSHLLATTRSASQKEMDRQLLEAAESRRSLNRLLATGAYVGARDRRGRTALHFVADYMCDKDDIKLLLGAGADVEARDSNGRTVLHYAAAATSSYKQSRECLRQAGARVDARDRWLQIPLHCAVQADNLETVKELLAASSDVNAADVYGNTPLHLAAQRGNANVVKALLDLRAEKDAKNSLRETPLDVAKKCNNNQLLAILRFVDLKSFPLKVPKKMSAIVSAMLQSMATPSSWFCGLVYVCKADSAQCHFVLKV
ncbi:CARD- and ANK-domain containing inflammasome adapter protein-like [Schistocerca nitens]|uniref:CARD- and ANK-domain containing inflammasome adapter protein-like n=1 Tax=Schistocerca nitens TaxID=7011 RepID=UPI002117AD99|nr:CARD- and ANK-domain containing inflammasome adapter protein-like [Schistocerca nitens]